MNQSAHKYDRHQLFNNPFMTLVKHNEHQDLWMLIGHCHMYLYGASGSPEILLNEVAKGFYSFAMLHLISTMFLIKDSRNDKNGGVFHRILDKRGLKDLMTEIDSILSSPVGTTTLTEYIRQKRNKLATHGTLLIESQSNDVSEVTFNKRSIDQYTEAMFLLDNAVGNLLNELEEIYRIG